MPPEGNQQTRGVCPACGKVAGETSAYIYVHPDHYHLHCYMIERKTGRDRATYTPTMTDLMTNPETIPDMEPDDAVER